MLTIIIKKDAFIWPFTICRCVSPIHLEQEKKVVEQAVQEEVDKLVEECS